MHNDEECGLARNRTALNEHGMPKSSSSDWPKACDEDLAGQPDRDGLMYSPRVFLSICVVLLGFSLWTYYSTGAFGTTVIRTVVAGIILQSAYFLAIVYLVMVRVKARSVGVRQRQQDADGASGQDNAASVGLTLVDGADKP